MSAESALKTPLYDWHQAHGGRLVEFGGWSMPVQYTTIVEEHQAVRQRVGLFDISHMGRLTFDGPDALAWLERVTTNHVARLAAGQIQYSLMANGGGGLIDDILVYRLPVRLRDGLQRLEPRARSSPSSNGTATGATPSLIDRTARDRHDRRPGARGARRRSSPCSTPRSADVKYYHAIAGPARSATSTPSSAGPATRARTASS